MGVELEVRPDQGEVRIETGTGIIENVDGFEGSRRNVQVEIKPTHFQARYNVKAWADTKALGLADSLRAAWDSRSEIEYRIEVHRKDGVDPSIAIADLGNADKIRDLVSIKPVSGAERPATAEPERAAPSPSASPAPQPRPQQAAQAPIPDGPRWGPNGEPLNSAAADALEAREAAKAPEQKAHEADLATRPQNPAAAAMAAAGLERPKVEPSPTGRYGPRIEEGRPWHRLNSDGSLNLGSYEAKAALEFAALAYSLLIENARTNHAVYRTDLEPPTPAQVKNLGRILLEAADKAQAAVRHDGHVDRMDNSHTRARQAVRAALDVYPVPWGKSAEVRAEWAATLADHAGMLLRVAVDLIGGP